MLRISDIFDCLHEKRENILLNASIFTFYSRLCIRPSTIGHPQLDAQLDAMLEEWKPMVFEVFPWKTTRTYIVRKTDAIMTLLDEQIVKTQVRRGG